MNQVAFLTILNDGLAGLPAQEIDDILADYISYFDEAQASGRREEEVAAALGDARRLRATALPPAQTGTGSRLKASRSAFDQRCIMNKRLVWIAVVALSVSAACALLVILTSATDWVGDPRSWAARAA